MSEPRLPIRPATDALTLRLDRWASILRNWSNGDGYEMTLWDDERADLSDVCTEAANAIADARRTNHTTGAAGTQNRAVPEAVEAKGEQQ